MPEAVWFEAPRRVGIRHEQSEPLGPGDVRVEAVFSGLSAGSELLVYRGQAPATLEPDLPTIAGDFGFPLKFGYASVGRIIETGAAVNRPLDELVFVHHPHQTEYVAPAEAAVPLPPALPAELGIFSANLETALTVVLDAHPRLLEGVLIVGQGVVGLLVTMLLRRAGVRPLIALEMLPRRREASIACGADRVLAADDDVKGAIDELTGGRGVDVAIEASGNPSALQTCIDSTAFGGTVVVASWYGTRPVELHLGSEFHRRRLHLLSSQVSSLDPVLGRRWDRARRTQAVQELLGELPLSGLVTHRFPLHEAAAAYELLDRRPEECLQVVLSYV